MFTVKNKKIILLGLFIGYANAADSTFTYDASASNPKKIVLKNPAGETLEVTGPATPNSCFNNYNGTAELFVQSSCDQTIPMQFVSSGPKIKKIEFKDVYDMDCNPFRDAFAANVAGTWSSPSIEVHDFTNPPSTTPNNFDKTSRLTAAGAVGTFLANFQHPTDNGNSCNNKTEEATFTPTTATDTLTIFHDDVEGTRGAATSFILKALTLQIDPSAKKDEFIQDGVTGGTTASIFDNDSVGDNKADSTNVTATIESSPTPPASGGITLDTTTGKFTVAPNTSPGTYEYKYKICEIADPLLCDTTTATVVVPAVLKANPDSVNGIIGQPTTVDVLANDDGDLKPDTVRILDSSSNPVTSLTVPNEGKWTVDPVTGEIKFEPDSSFTGNPTPIQYTVEDKYKNKSQATVKVIYKQTPPPNTPSPSPSPSDNVDDKPAPITPIIANDDSSSIESGINGGTIPSVLDNDTIGGNPVTLGDIDLIPGPDPSPSSGSITMSADGTVIVAPGTTPGTYTYGYTICEKGNANNCDSSSVTIEVKDTQLLPYIQSNIDGVLANDLAITLSNQSNTFNSYSGDSLRRFSSKSKKQSPALKKETQKKSMRSCLADVNDRLKQEKIKFDTNKAIIKSQSLTVIDEIISILNSCNDESKFEIAGHTDSDASDAYNLDLSKRRAQAVLTALAERGYDAANIVARGYGEAMPIASNATRKGKAMNRRVEFNPLNTAEETYKTVEVETPNSSEASSITTDCANSKNDPKMYAQGNDDSLTIKGAIKSESYDCNTGTWGIIEGSANYYSDDNDRTNAQFGFSYRREGFINDSTLTGWSVGAYGKQNDVNGISTGTLTGYGLNASVYGASKFDNGIAVDGYIGAAAGKHSYNGEQETSIGTISSESDYTYLGGFAGAALSGEIKVTETTNASPRVGIDYAYTPSADVNVDMQLENLQQNGSFAMDSIGGGRAFAEIRGEQSFNDGNAAFAVTPRVACYQSMGSEADPECAYGGSIELLTGNPESGYSFSIKLDAEKGEYFQRGSVSGNIKKKLSEGVFINGNTSANSEGDYSVGVGLDVKL